MTRRLAVAVAAVIFVCASARGADEVLYQIELIPSGKALSKDLPVLKGTTYLYHAFPTGVLVSVRKSTVKQITKLDPKAAAAVNPKTQLVQIRDLPFQGPKSGASRGWTRIDQARSAAAAANAGTAARTASPGD